MRFVFAIVAFIAAAVMIGLGIAQRTVFLESDRVSLDIAVDSSDADYLVISPEALAAYPGKQAITVAGKGSTYLAYGRTGDVLGWVGDDTFISVGFDAETGELTSTVVDPTEADDDTAADDTAADDVTTTEPAPTTPPADAATEADADAEPVIVSPAGSDLWLDELSEEQSRLTMTIDVPSEVSVLVASGSQDPVPDRIGIAWPLDNSTPWVGPLLTGGTVVFLVGVWLVISGILHHRRSRGPRRNLPKGGSKMKPLLSPKPGKAQLTSGRRSAGRRTAVAALVLVPVFGLTACAPEYWPSLEGAPATAEPTATPTATPGAEEAEEVEPVEPAVTVPQMERIMGKIAATTATADGALDPVAAEQRFVGPALDARKANYVIRAALPDQPGPVAVPASTPDQVVLPQQTKAGVWPRTVLTIAESDDPTIAPSALVLVQETPRDNFRILYASQLVPDADVPQLAPASIGAPSVTVDSKLLVMPPSQVGAAFADILMTGEVSTYASSFDLEGMDLDDTLNAAARKAAVESAQPTITLEVSTVAGDAPIVSLGTNDAGALVSTTVTRTEISRPNDGGLISFPAGQPASVLSGFTAQSAKGVQATRELQLLFYVPKVGSDEPIRLLGWSENLVSASEAP
ncbi:hypothetical protein ET445_11120 [Agromyces protaetiae]|uniref:Glycosyl transferase n=1 Tax=Agromyces protaetiae TaxID=2509455 RepID=A0A4P6FFF9_9MICO|nr:hypothetical protein [Agromyces protaetiae]QAY73813.1 hypothetical protein ET445_11120 [Agromyces protaetiae]